MYLMFGDLGVHAEEWLMERHLEIRGLIKIGLRQETKHWFD
jgi:hypothetical protein